MAVSERNRNFSNNLLGECAPAESVSSPADYRADCVSISFEISFDGLLTETIEVVVVDSCLGSFHHLSNDLFLLINIIIIQIWPTALLTN